GAAWGASNGCSMASARARAAKGNWRSISPGSSQLQRRSPQPEIVPARELARLLILAGLWGGSFAFIRVAVPSVGPLWLAFLRVALAFGALFVLALAKRNVPALRDRWRGYFVIGGVNCAFPCA